MRLRWSGVLLATLPLYSIAASIEACSSSTDLAGSTAPTSPSGTSTTPAGTATAPTDSGASAPACAADETVKVIAGQSVCCKSAGADELTCRVANANAPGVPCATVGATEPGMAYAATFDVCVYETCYGDRTCTEFPTVADRQTGTLACVASAGSATWQWSDTPAVHHVERACLVYETEVCKGPGYSTWNDATDYLAPAYWSGYGESCGYGGAYPIATKVEQRDLFLMSSTCTASGGGAPSPCSVGDL